MIRHALKKYGAIVLLCLLQMACESVQEGQSDTLFSRVPSSASGINFENRLDADDDFNIIEYLYFYNGAGVAVGDINNDGFPDLYFTSNQKQNKLYLNMGGLKFEDITESAGVGGTGNWSTGTSMADVNGDGYLDIFVCGVGHYKSFNGRNQLFINNGDLTFTEKTEAYGLDFQGFSTQAAFFDYDNDGDLDMYLLNHAVHTARSTGDVLLRYQSDPFAGDKLYRNERIPGGQPYFTEVTSRAGILSSQIGYGLGVAVSDLNRDGYMDIYVANDFHENDYLYINKGDGTFSQVLEKAVGHSSRFSMGTDIADLNNDAWADIFTLDMLPKDEAVIKTTAGEDSYEIFQLKLRSGFHYQFARNTLQLNRGTDDDGVPLYSDIACLAGVEASDWSWATLLADFDNDGYRDIFISNGIERRPNGLDYINYISDDSVQRFASDDAFIEKMPYGKVKNVLYRNRGDLTFEDVSGQWMNAPESLSNGAAYADFDNDGDLDLVVNNINEPAWLLRNDSPDSANSVTISFAGSPANRFGIGTKVFAWAGGRVSYHEVSPVRGWLSSVDQRVHIGLGGAPTADSIRIIWPDRSFQVLYSVVAGQSLVANHDDAGGMWQYPSGEAGGAFLTRKEDIPFQHKENNFVAFNVERLIPHMLSTQGPLMATGDINGDMLDDFFVGGAAGQEAAVFVQEVNGTFKRMAQPAFVSDKQAEDIGSAFFDANGDGALDLVVVSGGQEHTGSARELLPRLYMNDGKGNFQRAAEYMPDIFLNASCVKPIDIDNDGDQDLFIGGRVVAGAYGSNPRSYFLLNDGHGRFSEASQQLFQGSLGMVTDALWLDLNNDTRPDLVVAGEWMPVTVLVQTASGTFVDETEAYGLDKTNGWWNTLHGNDFDGDGDVDLVAGNLGLNSRLRASLQHPVSLYVHDIDGNGSLDQIMTYYNGGTRYPFASRDQLVKQVPAMKRKFLKYEDYAGVKLEDIVPSEETQVEEKNAYTFASAYLENQNGKFIARPLPTGAQMFPVFALASADVNNDGHPDILAAGNLSAVQPDMSRYDAGYGLVLYGDGTGNFSEDRRFASGLIVKGEARDIRVIKTSTGKGMILVARNDDTILCFALEPDRDGGE